MKRPFYSKHGNQLDQAEAFLGWYKKKKEKKKKEITKAYQNKN